MIGRIVFNLKIKIKYSWVQDSFVEFLASLEGEGQRGLIFQWKGKYFVIIERVISLDEFRGIGCNEEHKGRD